MILNADEVVEIFFKSTKPGGDYKISTTKLYRLAKLGKIPSFKLDGRVFFDEDALREWFKSQCSTTSTPAVLDRYGRDRGSKMERISESLRM